MNRMDRIIDEYRQGDFEQRMNLFLECRQLRSEFVRIEAQEFDRRKTSEAEGMAPARGGSWSVLRRLFCRNGAPC